MDRIPDPQESEIQEPGAAKYCSRCDLPISHGPVFQRCVCNKPKEARLPVLLAVLGSFIIAAGLFLFALHYYEMFPDKEQASKIFAQANDAFGAGNFGDAESLYKQSVWLDPKRAEMHQRYAIGLLCNRKPHEGLQEMEIALRLAPHNQEYAKQHVGFLESTYGNGEKALEQVQLLMQSSSNKVPYEFECAKICDGLGRFSEAERYYRSVVAHEPKFDAVWILMSNVLIRDGKSDQSLAVLKEGVKAAPESPGLHQRLGEVLAEKNQIPAAVAELKIAAHLNPASAEIIGAYITHLTDNGQHVQTLVPLRRFHNSYLVEVVLNEKVRAHLTLDSGAEACIISTDLAKRLKLRLDDAPRIGMVSVTGMKYVPKVLLSVMRVGTVREANVPALVHDMPPGVSDGLLGMSFLNRFTVNLDTQGNVLSLSTNK